MAAGVLATALVLGSSVAQAQQVVSSFDEQGFADTPLARRGLSISAHIEEQETCDGYALAVQMTTTNQAMMDGGTGCMRIALMQGGGPASTFMACTPPNALRGLRRATVQFATQYFVVPQGLEFDALGFRFFNPEHGGESIDWVHIVSLMLRRFVQQG